MGVPEGRDVLREVSLWASVSLYSQREQRWEGAHPPGGTRVAASDPTAQGRAKGEAGRAESRGRGRSPSLLQACTCSIFIDGNRACFTDLL